MFEALVSSLLSNKLIAFLFPLDFFHPHPWLSTFHLVHFSLRKRMLSDENYLVFLPPELKQQQYMNCVYWGHGRRVHIGVSRQPIQLCGTSTHSHRHGSSLPGLLPSPLHYLPPFSHFGFEVFVHLQFKVLTYHSYRWLSLKLWLPKKLSKTIYDLFPLHFYIILVELCASNFSAV